MAAARRRHIAFLLPVLLVCPSLVALTPAEQPPAAGDDRADAAPQVENTKFQYSGIVNGNGVLVRSGPSNNFYPTMKLDKGAKVTVVGIKYDWLKIIPPEGSFSYVPQVFVTRRGDGKVGRVNNALNVRAGSSLNQIKTTIQTKLQEGQDVTILGEQDEYFKISPPKEAYVYINKQHVKPDQVISNDEVAVKDAKDTKEPKEGVEEKKEQVADTGKPQQDGDTPTTPGEATNEGGERGIADASPGTQPTQEEGRTGVADAGNGPTSRPSAVATATEYRKAEADFEAASKLPVVEQPIDELAERYAKLADSGALSTTARQMVDARLRALKIRGEVREELKAFNHSKQEFTRKQKDLAMEAGEIQERLKETQVSIYAAVGMLRVSSIQQGNSTLYRLTDPATGRTVVYIRSNDPAYAGLLNQFVGVKGDLTTDERLRMKIISPTEAQAVDAAKVNSTVIATITPPSMLPIANTDLRETGN
jgi:uncharacterized protein YgiM (DUF1202 family)